MHATVRDEEPDGFQPADRSKSARPRARRGEARSAGAPALRAPLPVREQFGRAFQIQLHGGVWLRARCILPDCRAPARARSQGGKRGSIGETKERKWEDEEGEAAVPNASTPSDAKAQRGRGETAPLNPRRFVRFQGTPPEDSSLSRSRLPWKIVSFFKPRPPESASPRLGARSHSRSRRGTGDKRLQSGPWMRTRLNGTQPRGLPWPRRVRGWRRDRSRGKAVGGWQRRTRKR